jgi:GTP-binding protein
MDIKSATFEGSTADYTKCPNTALPEYAFIGRSNVGKSSLINMITQRNGLAKTSGTPGKTQVINHFLINNEWYLVDLPGYGWAKVSQTQREKFGNMIREYLQKRTNLQCVFVLIDSRHEPQAVDMTFIEWLGTNQIPFSIVFTKADKQSKTRTAANVAAYNKRLKDSWEELPMEFITSAEERTGRIELLSYIEKLRQRWKEA